MLHKKSNGKFARIAFTILNSNIQITVLGFSGNG